MNVNKELARLRKMSMADLRQQYEAVWNEPTRSGNRDYLTKRIIWRMQALAEGDLTERARRRALAMANDADLRIRPLAPGASGSIEDASPTVVHTAPGRHDPTLPGAGAVLTRQWRGRTVQARILADGTFEYEGDTYRSLSAVARAVTGSHWNGRLFFNLPPSRPGKDPRK